ncbi:hypothetical protein BTJ49_15140 [Oleiagrimonas sp. MCCC 1A03011]|nr:hypothetical protein BTJ49_15140 [Oleiagrimonas sp. MCCC 1A03011]
MLFNGFEHFGSLEESAAQARARRRETLTDLRNELFFVCRRSRHQDSDEYVGLYQELLPLLQQAIRAQQHGA